ncbi:MAG TPA: hypothetical protein PLT43_10725, partial [Mesotoga sp.]|nr:hypothetical protein [Mesotoga sp.]
VATGTQDDKTVPSKSFVPRPEEPRMTVHATRLYNSFTACFGQEQKKMGNPTATRWANFHCVSIFTVDFSILNLYYGNLHRPSLSGDFVFPDTVFLFWRE